MNAMKTRLLKTRVLKGKRSTEKIMFSIGMLELVRLVYLCVIWNLIGHLATRSFGIVQAMIYKTYCIDVVNLLKIRLLPHKRVDGLYVLPEHSD